MHIYILIDLPEINLISSYYLKSYFPNKKFLLYEDFQNDKNININNYDICILPPWCLIDEIQLDFVINIRSMMEMEKHSINQYFEFIQKNLRINGYFLNCNRYHSSDNGYNFYFHKFHYDKKWKIIMSETSWLQKNIHFLLTQRVNNTSNEIESLFKELSIFVEKRTKYKKNFFYKTKIFFKNLLKKNHEKNS